MEKSFNKKQVGAIGFVVAIVTAAVMLMLQMFGVTTPTEPKAEKAPAAVEAPAK